MAVTPRRRLNRGPRPQVNSRNPAGAAGSSRPADVSRERGKARGARRPACDACGHFADVQLLAGYRGGHPVRRQLCLACARATPQLLRPLPPSRHLRLDAALALAGFVLCLLGAARDFLPTPAGGFGWHQVAGVSIGALFVVLGLMTRADFLAAGGVVVLGLSGAADLVLKGGSTGIGWKQELIIVFGLLLILAGLRLRHLRRRADAALAVSSVASVHAHRAAPEAELAVS